MQKRVALKELNGSNQESCLKQFPDRGERRSFFSLDFTSMKVKDFFCGGAALENVSIFF